MLKNKELRRGLLWLVMAGGVLIAFGFAVSPVCGVIVLLTWALCTGVYLVTETKRYRRLRKMSRALDALLLNGAPLKIREYSEGELSILANQIQKITQKLLDAHDAMQKDKLFLADSLADISHQLRTPLTAMNLTAAMLRSPELTAQHRMELAAEQERLLERTEWLVVTLLKLSKLDAGTVLLQQTQVSVAQMIRRAVEPIAISMDLRNQQLQVRCGSESFLGDETWSAEALGNILKNCMEHTPEGGTITVTAEQTALFTKITVSDTGPGFAPEDIPRLFERFYKGKSASQNSYGIGLALARTVIAAQNGTVQAMNGPEGAVFEIKFYKQVI